MLLMAIDPEGITRGRAFTFNEVERKVHTQIFLFWDIWRGWVTQIRQFSLANWINWNITFCTSCFNNEEENCAKVPERSFSLIKKNTVNVCQRLSQSTSRQPWKITQNDLYSSVVHILKRPSKMTGYEREFIKLSVVPAASRKQWYSSQRQRNVFGNESQRDDV